MTKKIHVKSSEMVRLSNKSNCSDEYDDDNDSLGCAISDYNKVFYGE